MTSANNKIDSDRAADARFAGESGAIISACGRYRYALWRRWQPGPALLFVMLNPSTADAANNDPTIRRCIGFAQSWGFGSLLVGNLFALRTPSPKRLLKARAPVGPDNAEWLQRLQQHAELTVAGWGNHGQYRRAGTKMRLLLTDPKVLGLTKLGEPRHPLYVPASARAEDWD